MAKILQPETVIRFDPNDYWNKEFNRGFKWHTLDKTKSGCGIILEDRATETKPFSEVKAKDLCAICFKGLKVVDVS